jgi:hypothetical protein
VDCVKAETNRFAANVMPVIRERSEPVHGRCGP